MVDKPWLRPFKKQSSFHEQFLVGHDTDGSDVSRFVEPAPVGEEPPRTGACGTLSSLHEVQAFSLQARNSANASKPLWPAVLGGLGCDSGSHAPASAFGLLGAVPLATQGPTQGPPESRMRTTRQWPMTVAAPRGNLVNHFYMTVQLNATTHRLPVRRTIQPAASITCK